MKLAEIVIAVIRLIDKKKREINRLQVKVKQNDDIFFLFFFFSEFGLDFICMLFGYQNFINSHKQKQRKITVCIQN